MRYGPVFLFIVSMSKQVIGGAQLFAVTKFGYFPTPWPIPRRLSAYVRVRTIYYLTMQISLIYIHFIICNSYLCKWGNLYEKVYFEFTSNIQGSIGSLFGCLFNGLWRRWRLARFASGQ